MKNWNGFTLEDVILPVYAPMWEDNDAQYIVCKGGCASGKSYNAALWMVHEMYWTVDQGMDMVAYMDKNISIRNSVMPSLLYAVRTLGLEDDWRMNNHECYLECIHSGNKILCHSMDNIQRNVREHSPKVVWIEEATMFTDEEWTIIQTLNPHAKFIITCNDDPWSIPMKPWIEALCKDPKAMVIESSYKDNRYLSIDDMKRFKERYDMYYGDPITVLKETRSDDWRNMHSLKFDFYCREHLVMQSFELNENLGTVFLNTGGEHSLRIHKHPELLDALIAFLQEAKENIEKEKREEMK